MDEEKEENLDLKSFPAGFKISDLIDEISHDPRPKKMIKVADSNTDMHAIEFGSQKDENDNIFNQIVQQKSPVSISTSEDWKTLQKKKYTRKSKNKWSKEDRANFYKGLTLFGLDYSMISATVLQNRSTREIAAFLKREDKKNQGEVDLALKKNRVIKPLKAFSIEEMENGMIPSLEQVMMETCNEPEVLEV